MKIKQTIKDVAKKSGYSVSTISLVVNKKPNVAKKAREEIQKVIDELGFHPQRSARGLASSASGNIGFIATNEHFTHAEPFYTKVFLGTEFEARKYHYYVLLTTVGYTMKETDEIPRFLLEHNIDGVIIAGKIGSSWLDYIRKRNIPLLLVDYELPRSPYSSVVMDNRTGARLVVQHLRKGGHTKIGFIGGDMEHPSIGERYHAFREELESAGLPIKESWTCIDGPDTRLVDGHEAAKKIFFDRSDRPTAVFAANDIMAIGCMRYLKDAGLKVPNDVAVVGFDNIEAALHVEPRLTTVNVHREELGSLAVRRIVEMIKDKSTVVTKTLVPVELIVRESCGIESEPTVSD